MSVSRRSMLGALAAAPIAIGSAAPALASMNLDHVFTHSDKPAVFFVPHQDDELLIMGSAIYQHVQAGREVHVVLLGRGDMTKVRFKDMPPLLGYTPTGEEIGKVRDREFKNCLWRLGVKTFRHIPDFKDRMTEKQFNMEQTLNIMRSYVNALPGADCKTVSMFDPNPDHAILGESLRYMQNNGELAVPPRFYVAPWALDQTGLPRLARETAELPYGVQHPYRRVNLANDEWGVGYKSVPSYFRAHANNRTSYRHS